MAQRRQWMVVGGVLACLGGLLIAGLRLSPDIGHVSIGTEAPDFAAMDIVTGDTVRLADLRGEVVLLNIWATWCIPCEQEMPSLQRLYEALEPEGLRLVAISVDQVGPEAVRSWVEERNLTFPVLQDRSARIERNYQTTGMPETFIIDRNGVIVHKVIGAEDWSLEPQVARLRRFLAAGQDG